MTLHDTETEAPSEGTPAPAPRRPAGSGGTSLRPAMVVLGLAVLILAVFVTIGVVFSQSPTKVHTGSASDKVVGTTLRAVPAAGALAPIVGSGEPPSNILNAVAVPTASVRTGHQNNAGQSGQYDSQVELRSTSSQGALLGFFAATMRAQGWQVFDQGPAANNPGALEVLGKLAGDDGYYWEMGATIKPTSFGNGAPATGWTTFTVRLLQESDDQS
ncbi:MAG TPA: hypothetical protein VHS57_08335 [Acidimicrobiales bacterium]|nr:hypothetical protein [Acidimicrobiales bacterium]